MKSRKFFIHIKNMSSSTNLGTASADHATTAIKAGVLPSDGNVPDVLPPLVVSPLTQNVPTPATTTALPAPTAPSEIILYKKGAKLAVRCVRIPDETRKAAGIDEEVHTDGTYAVCNEDVFVGAENMNVKLPLIYTDTSCVHGKEVTVSNALSTNIKNHCVLWQVNQPHPDKPASHRIFIGPPERKSCLGTTLSSEGTPRTVNETPAAVSIQDMDTNIIVSTYDTIRFMFQEKTKHVQIAGVVVSICRLHVDGCIAKPNWSSDHAGAETKFMVRYTPSLLTYFCIFILLCAQVILCLGNAGSRASPTWVAIDPDMLINAIHASVIVDANAIIEKVWIAFKTRVSSGENQTSSGIDFRQNAIDLVSYFNDLMYYNMKMI